MKKLFYYLPIVMLFIWNSCTIPNDYCGGCAPPIWPNLIQVYYEVKNHDTSIMYLDSSQFNMGYAYRDYLSNNFAFTSPYNWEDPSTRYSEIVEGYYSWIDDYGRPNEEINNNNDKFAYYSRLIGDTQYNNSVLLAKAFVDTLKEVHVYLNKNYNNHIKNQAIDKILTLGVSEPFLYIQNNYNYENLGFIDIGSDDFNRKRTLVEYNSHIHPFASCSIIFSFDEALKKTDTFTITTEYVFTNNKVLRTIAEDIIIRGDAKK